MELIIFLGVGIAGFASLLIYKLYMYSVTVQTGGRDKNYYYKRFMRNKEQVESYIEIMQHSITLYNCGNEVFGDQNLTAQNHLDNLKRDYENDYTDITQKILKRNRLSRKDKKKYVKLLADQSEKLFNVEGIQRLINQKYRTN